jgi:hypothetical protein
VIELTERAAAAVEQASSAARRFDPDAHIRLVRAGTGVRFEFIDSPDPTDTSVDAGAVTLLVEAGIEGLLDAGEHQAPVLLPHP